MYKKWLFAICLFAFLGPYFSDGAIDLSCKNLPPGKTHWFGTDELGRDVFYRTAIGVRLSLSIAIFAMIINTSAALFWALFSVWKGGRFDRWCLGVFDILQSIPYLLVIMCVTFLLGPSFQTTLFAITLTGWIPLARIARAELMHLKRQDYALAAKVLGASSSQILFRHLLPNAVGPILTAALLNLQTALFAEAFISFLGLGIEAPNASLGALLNDGASGVSYFPWRFFFPALALILLLSSLHAAGRRLQMALS